MEELSPQDGHKPRQMSEETKNVIFELENIEAFELVEFIREEHA